MEKIVLGQECVVPHYGLGRITEFVDTPTGRSIGVTPYVAGYQMVFAESNVTVIPLQVNSQFPEFKEELDSLNAILDDKQDVEKIMAMSLNELRKELLIELASSEDKCRSEQRWRETCLQLETRLEKQTDFMQAFRGAIKAFPEILS
jgi:hypothetical protein